MKTMWICTMTLLVSSCALQGVVQRQTVEYNTAAAGMANELALMNIIRAKEHLPIFYTSISRLSGSAVITATGGFNAAFKTSSPVDTTSTTSAAPNTSTTTDTSNVDITGNKTLTTEAVATTVGPAITKMASRAVTSGGNVYTPSIGGQIATGPSFDINILDTQQFYQGVLGEVPFSTIELFLNQGFDNELVMRLLIEKIELRYRDEVKPIGGNPGHKKGALAHVIENIPTDNDPTAAPETSFTAFISCVQLRGESEDKPAKGLAPVSLITGDSANPRALTIRDLALLDGDKLDLGVEVKSDEYDTKGVINGNPEHDKKIFVVRPSHGKRLPKFDDASCATRVFSQSATPRGGQTASAQQTDPSRELGRKFSIQSFQEDPDSYSRPPRSAGVVKFNSGPEYDYVIVFRSPEGVIRFLGSYLEASDKSANSVFGLKQDSASHGSPLFSVVTGRTHNSLVTTEVLGAKYFIERDSSGGGGVNMTVLALLEELIDLQKAGADRPVTVPVHVLP